MSSLTLYHFTCDDHGYPGITSSQTIKGRTHPLFPHLGPLVWLTDQSEIIDPYDVGLTSEHLPCDRTAKRFFVTCKAAVPWTSLRVRVRPEVLSDLESYGKPETWWVVRRPITRSEFEEVRPSRR
jgi:hypothetical protein